MKTLTPRSNHFLNASLAQYSEMSEVEKTKAVKHVADQLNLSEQGEKIGFPLDPDMVAAAKEFLKEIK